MIRKAVLASAILCWYFCPRCPAQDVRPTFQLSTDETAQARQADHALQSAEDRATQGGKEWRTFDLTYAAAHPELQRLTFAADFKFAFASPSGGSYETKTVAAVELTPEEQHRAQKLHQEMTDSRDALQQQQKKWIDFQHQLIANHIPEHGGGGVVTLPNGKQYIVPQSWDRGLAFTPDFRFAVAR
jgi:hypothetical protein